MNRLFLLVIFIAGISQVSYSQWEPCNNGLLSNDLICVVTNGNRIIVGTNNGIFISSDIGNSWEKKNTGLKDTLILCIAANSNIIIAGTPSGIYYSSNNGDTWEERNNGLSEKYINTLAISGNIMLAGTRNGIFISDDYGKNWNEKDKGIETKWINSIFIHGKYIWAGTSGYLYYSTDNGNNWKTNNQDFYSPTDIRSMALSGNTFYILNRSRIGYSTNLGVTWNWIEIIDFYHSASAFAVYDSNIIVYTDVYGMFKSSDNGDSWVPINTKLDFKYNSVKSIVLRDDFFLLLSDWKIFISKDKTDNYRETNNWFWNRGIGTIAVKDNNVFVGTNTKGLYFSTDNGNNWEIHKDISQKSAITANLVNNGLILLGTRGDGIYISSDNGINWKKNSNGLIDVEFNKFIKLNDNIFAGTSGYGILISSDNGATWKERNDGLINKNIQQLASIENNLFALNDEGKIFFSSDLGNSWIERYPPINGSMSYSFEACGKNLFAGVTYKGLYISSDLGISWVKIENDTLSSMVYGGTYSNKFHIFINGNFGSKSIILASTDFGVTWINISNSMNDTGFLNFGVDKDNIYCGCNSLSGCNDIYHAKLSDFGITDVKETCLVEKKELLIIPNPAYDVISISLPAGYINDGNKHGGIFNMLGICVAGSHPINYESFPINVSGLAPGVYTVRFGAYAGMFVKE